MSMKGKYRHLEWLELEGGILTECAIMKRAVDGHTWFFPVSPLDNVDKQRLLNILRNRNAELYELWDLMSQITLGNGVNAASYFNQLVKVRTPAGQIVPFGAGKYGTPTMRTVSRPAAAAGAEDTQEMVYDQEAMDSELNQQQLVAAVAAAKSATGRRRG